MAQDEALFARFEEISRSSTNVRFRRLNSTQLSDEIGADLARSPNPVYSFSVNTADSFEAIAFTLLLNASVRPATRAEALGRSIAMAGDALFDRNPLLLIYDYVGRSFMAVSAAKLFGVFATEAAAREIQFSATSRFTLTPNFENGTVNMYGTVSGGDVWSCSSLEDLDVETLTQNLIRIRDETRTADRDFITEAIRSRINAQPKQDVEAKLAVVSTSQLRADVSNDDVRVPDRVRRMIVTAIKSSPAVILVGPPGTGKTALLRKIVQELAEAGDDVAPDNELLWVTPDESWTVHELVGGDTIVDNQIAFRPGWLLRALEEDRWLVLDEANRGDMDRIFGGTLTWLAGGTVVVGAEHSGSNARSIKLGWTLDRTGRFEIADDGAGSVLFAAGPQWRLLGTYNAVDAQRVFRFGQALGRRFARVPIPAIDSDDLRDVLVKRETSLPEGALSAIVGLYQAHNADVVSAIGPAQFFSMAAYLRIAMEGTVPESEHGSIERNGPTGSGASAASHEDQRDLVAEAYVVHVGTFLAQLESRDLYALRDRTVANGSVGDEDWVWIETMLPSLG